MGVPSGVLSGSRRFRVLLLIGSLNLIGCQVGTATSSIPSPSVRNEPSGEVATGWIAFGREDTAVGDFVIYVIDANGASVRKLLDGAHELPRWSPDGSRLSITVTDGVGIHTAIVNRAGGGLRTLTAPDASLNLACAAWSPDGTRLACEGWDDHDITRNGLYTVRESDGGDIVRLTSSPGGGHDIPGGYSPDGGSVVFERAREGVPSEIMTVAATGGADPFLLGDDYTRPAWSHSGRRIVVDRGGSLYLLTPEGGTASRISIDGAPTGSFAARWSPDDTWLVFSLEIGSGGDVYRVHPDGSGLTRLTADPANEEMADWAAA
jgi:Tol biopolymer transport system component